MDVAFDHLWCDEVVYESPVTKTIASVDSIYWRVKALGPGACGDGPWTSPLVYIFTNRAPVSDAGKDQTVVAGKLVMLDGSGSYDPDGDTLSCQWALDASNPVRVVLSDASAVNFTFTPSLPGRYGFVLVVNDGTADSTPDTVKVMVLIPGDFNGDGRVDLSDFSLFVTYYSLCEGDDGFDPLYDLDGDGCIGLGDFSIFVTHYGEMTGGVAKAVSVPVGKVKEASLSIDIVDRSEGASRDVKLKVRLDEVGEFKGYSFKVRYDPVRFDFRGANRVGEGFLRDGNSLWPLLVVSHTAEEILIADVVRGDEVAEGGVLVELCFKCKETPEHAKFTVTEGIFMDAEGEIHALGSAEVASLPQKFVLLQNFPNPFNTSTVIRVRLPEASEVRLSIYNLLGQEIRRLIDGEMEAGTHSVQWDGRDDSGRVLASGVYLCRFQAGDFTQTKRIVLLR